jgi:hypothetical protein
MPTRGRRFAAYLEMQKFKLTARLRSLLPVDLRLQCGREFDQRDIRNRPTAVRRLVSTLSIPAFSRPHDKWMRCISLAEAISVC